eukprot:236810_1
MRVTFELNPIQIVVFFAALCITAVPTFTSNASSSPSIQNSTTSVIKTMGIIFVFTDATIQQKFLEKIDKTDKENGLLSDWIPSLFIDTELVPNIYLHQREFTFHSKQDYPNENQGQRICDEKIQIHYTHLCTLFSNFGHTSENSAISAYIYSNQYNNSNSITDSKFVGLYNSVNTQVIAPKSGITSCNYVKISKQKPIVIDVCNTKYYYDDYRSGDGIDINDRFPFKADCNDMSCQTVNVTLESQCTDETMSEFTIYDYYCGAVNPYIHLVIGLIFLLIVFSVFSLEEFGLTFLKVLTMILLCGMVSVNGKIRYISKNGTDKHKCGYAISNPCGTLDFAANDGHDIFDIYVYDGQNELEIIKHITLHPPPEYNPCLIRLKWPYSYSPASITPFHRVNSITFNKNKILTFRDWYPLVCDNTNLTFQNTYLFHIYGSNHDDSHTYPGYKLNNLIIENYTIPNGMGLFYGAYQINNSTLKNIVINQSMATADVTALVYFQWEFILISGSVFSNILFQNSDNSTTFIEEK